jgi:hypothetical protein
MKAVISHEVFKLCSHITQQAPIIDLFELTDAQEKNKIQILNQQRKLKKYLIILSKLDSYRETSRKSPKNNVDSEFIHFCCFKKFEVFGQPASFVSILNLS